MLKRSNSELPCLQPNISGLETNQTFPPRSDIHIRCSVTVYPQAHIYWLTPWGQYFAHDSTGFDWNDLNITVKQSRQYLWPLEKINEVSVDEDGTLRILNFQGWLSGKYMCAAVNEWGSNNITMGVNVHSLLGSMILDSLPYAGGGPACMLIIGFLIGMIKLCVKKCRWYCGFCCRCCCCCGLRKVKVDIEDRDCKFSTLDSGIDYEEIIFQGKSNPHKLFNTPFVSPEKCTTPTGEEHSEEDHESSDKLPPPSKYITETLDEVKLRLEKKVDRMKTKVSSMKESGSQYITTIKESGSQYISTIKDTGSQAAIRVKAGMVLGVEQVKSGVMSFKEFCGTGEMGMGTISVISVSTDIDSEQQTEVVKTVTYV